MSRHHGEVSILSPYHRSAWPLSLLVTLLVLPSCIGVVQAGLTAEEKGGELFLSCRSDNDCVLTPTPIGEEKVSEQSTATAFQSQQLVFEFTADPGQEHLAILPERLDLMEIDFRHQTEAGALMKPAMELRLILGQSVNVWSFEADVLPQTGTYEPYKIEDASLDHSNSRVIWAQAPIRLIMTVTLDRPGTWELNMRGASTIEMDVPWSIDAEAANIDEPSSPSQPIETSFEDTHRGALLGDDKDCWAFEVEEHEVLRLMVQWDAVPLELEQPHSVPDLVTQSGRLSPQPEVLTESDGDGVSITYRWRALAVGPYNLCMRGIPDHFQSYSWGGLFSYEGIGPTNPSGFADASYYPHGAVILGDDSEAFVLHEQGIALLLLSSLLFGVFLLLATRQTTSYKLRYGLLVPGVLLLFAGGILHPLWAMADEVQLEDEVTLDTLIDMRLQQLWDISAPGVPEQTLVTHTGATWGMLNGETLKLRLSIQEVLPLSDGRWQLIVPELESYRLDQAIFSQVAKGENQVSTEGLLEDQTVRFILLAGRSLLLDMMMLEALLVVDELPESSVFHIEYDMVAAKASGSVNAPAWATRPSVISTSDWVRLQGSLFPERISISLCDCSLDLLDVTFIPSSGFDEADIPPNSGLRNAIGLLPYGTALMWMGLLLGIVATSAEVQRYVKAQKMATTLRGTNDTLWK